MDHSATFRVHAEIMRPESGSGKCSVAQVRVQCQATTDLIETAKPVVISGLEPSAAILRFDIHDVSQFRGWILNTDIAQLYPGPFDFTAAVMFHMWLQLLEVDTTGPALKIANHLVVCTTLLGLPLDRMPRGMRRRKQWDRTFGGGFEALFAFDPKFGWGWERLRVNARDRYMLPRLDLDAGPVSLSFEPWPINGLRLVPLPSSDIAVGDEARSLPSRQRAG